MHRGFLYRGWARSPATAPIAIVVISLLWAAMHFQYDWFSKGQIVVYGLMLGWLRWRSGSTLLTILLHLLVNLEGSIETLASMRWGA